MVFEAPNCAYDVIVGRSWLQPNGFDILFSSGLMQWCGKEVPMKPENQPALFVHSDEDSADMFPTNLMPSSYDAADINKVVEAQTHLTDEQRQKLKAVFERYPTLFDNRLKKWPHGKVHLEPKEGAEPVHCRPFPVPDATRETFKNEMERLVDIGVLRHVGLSKHAYPTYAIPKKDGRIRIVSDFRRLNAQLKRNIYPLPRIQDLLHRNAKYQWLTKIDLSMYYYHFELDDESKDMCVIITPFGKYGYNRLPMGMLQSSDIAQEAIEWVLRDLDFAAGFIDDIGVRTDNNFDAHLQDLICVLDRLQENNLTVNPLKCEWCVQETDWLGYWLTPSGLKPWKKKIEGMLNVQRPRTLKQLRSFIGAINFYRDMWPHRAKILAPLTAQSGATQFLWTPDMEAAFVQAKSMIATDALLSYPDPTKPYCIHTDASDYQLGAVILREGTPVAYFSRKLSPAQRNSSTIEKELLSIVETFKEFRTMLFGADLTDHRNLTFDCVTQTADCYINMAPNTPNPISYDRVAHAQQLTPGLIGLEFQRMLQLWGIQPVPISTRNPQANAVCERMHLTAGNILRTIVNTNPRPNTYQDAKAMVAYAISTTLHALRITAHSTLRASPGSIVFNRDMLVDVPYVANLLDLRQRRQQLIDYNLRRENNRRRTFDYQPGQRVWEILQGTGKLQPKKRGPYLVIAVHTNGTITIERRPGVTERMNIRLFEPCHP